MLSRLPRASAQRLAARAAFGSSALRSAASRSSGACLSCLPRLRAVASSSPYPSLSLHFYSSQTDKKKEDKPKKNDAKPGSKDEEGSGGVRNTPTSPGPAELPRLPDGWVWLSVEATEKARPLLTQSTAGPAWLAPALSKQLDQFFENAIQIMVPSEFETVFNSLIDPRDVGTLARSLFQAAMRTSSIMEKMSQWPDLIEKYGPAVLKSGGTPNPHTYSDKQSDQQQGEPQDEQKSSRRQDEDQKSTRQQRGKQDAGSGRQSSDGAPNRPSRAITLTDILAATVGTIAIMPFLGKSGQSQDITWQELRRNFLDKGLVEKLEVQESVVKVFLNHEAVMAMYPDSPAAKYPYFNYFFNIGSVEAFERRLEDAQTELGIPASERIPVRYLPQNRSIFLSLFFAFGPTLMMVGLLAWGLRNVGSTAGGRNNPFNFGKSQAKRFNHETAVKVKFADVAGMDEAKLEIQEFVSFLKTPERFQRLGAKIPRGAILSGPPGTGKTLLAKATAGESQVPFFSVSGSEFVEMFVGVGASRVRDLFSSARKNAPCIIFIDEIDAIGRSRDGAMRGSGNDEREATLNQILTEMDGFNTTEQVVVLAGTNRPDVLDAALTRPGRFDRRIHIDRPTLKGRQEIFKVHLRKIVTNEDLDNLVGRLAVLTPGFAGADIANACNEAALVAARANAESVTLQHFEQAIERVIAGLERKSLVLSDEEKETVAYHEAGHAVCGWYFRWADPLLKVSIIPRGSGALGYAQYVPGDAYLMTTSQLMDRMAMTLGGRVSEEMHFATVTTGASDDFQKVTKMATTMVTQWGMSKALGPLHYNNDQNQWQKPFAEATAQLIDAEVRKLIDQAYKQCTDLLQQKKDEIGIIAKELLRKEVLTRDDMIRLLGPRPWPDKEDFSKFFGEVTGTNKKAGRSYPPPVAGSEVQTTPAP